MRIKPGLFTLSSFGLAAAALLTSPLVHAQVQGSDALLAHPTARIAEPISESALVTLKNNISPMAQPRFDQGVAAPATETGRIQLLLRPSAAQHEALREYLGELQDPNSGNYHKWLTPQSYGASFGISDADLEKVEAWLQGEGFTVESVPASRNLITFSGTFAQVAQAFHTSVHTYLVNGVKHYSNASDPSIPAALAPVVLGLSPLNDFHPRPMHTQAFGHTVKAQGHSLKVVSEARSAATPLLTAQDGNGNDLLLVAPGDAATIYDSPNSLNSHFSGSTQQTGQGVNIGVVGVSDLPTADYLNYRSLFLNETNPAAPTIVNDGAAPGPINDGSSAEALIDTELSSALAPKAAIYYYVSADSLLQDGALNAAIRAVEDNQVAILSVSFGECEYDLGPAGNAEIAAVWQQAAAQGITVLVSSGDSGSAACDASGIGDATGGLAVSGFASTPYNIAVGGTDFDVLSNSFSTYVQSSQSSTASSSDYYNSVLQYIPENPWNDSISNNPPGSYTQNTLQQYTDSSGDTVPVVEGGGGGPSSQALCAEVGQDGNCLTTLTGYPTPSFQTGISLSGQNPDGAPTGVRYLPDVSLFASADNLHSSSWAICADQDVNEGNTTGTDCEPDPTTGYFGISAYGGTSTASPAFAGILAMVVQSLGANERLGLANNVLYNLDKTQSTAGIFHDITAGNISEPCQAAANYTDCGSNGFLKGWNAGTGYDLATGLGSVDISKLVSKWDAAAFTGTSVTLTAGTSANSLGTSALDITHGTAVTLATSVTPSAATGTVSITGSTEQAGEAVNEDIALSNGSGQATVNDLPGGSYDIKAYYPGDVTHSPSTSSSIAVTVNPEASSPFFAIFAYEPTGNGSGLLNPSTLPYGYQSAAIAQPANASAAFSNGTVSGSHGVATGTVTLQNNGNTFSTSQFTNPQALNAQGVASFATTDLAPGSYKFGASYSGDKSYNASSTSTPISFTITKGVTQLSVSSTSTTSGTANVVALLETDSVGNFPTGPITLTGNGKTFSGTVVSGTLSDGTVAVQATFTLPAASLPSGSNTLTASYPGDTNYNGSSGTVTISACGTTTGFCLSSQSSSLSLTSGQSSGPDTITVSPTNGFTGTVALACKVQVSLAAGTLPTCSLSASSVNVTGTAAQSATLTVNTTALSALQPMHGPDGHRLQRLFVGGSGLALCSVLLFGIPGRRRSWQSILAVLLAFGVLGAIGCGGTATSGSSGTQPGTYKVTVTGTSGSITANTVVNVTVQ